MKRTAISLTVVFLVSAFSAPALRAQTEDLSLTKARAARDAGDTAALQSAIRDAAAQASRQSSAENYSRLALLNDWMCEAAQAHNDDKLIKQSAQSGVDAAETAVKLDPNSSRAHWLLGDLLGQLIPHVFAGGVRYGARSTNEMEKAIALDPRNAGAYVSRATSYYFTPAMFGGDKEKAVEFLQKAIAIDAASDAADTAHIWLASIYNEQGKHSDAVHEINEALRLNPHRGFAQFTAQAINSGKKTAASSN